MLPSLWRYTEKIQTDADEWMRWRKKRGKKVTYLDLQELLQRDDIRFFSLRLCLLL